MKNNKGFTLIELLAVIAVLAIVAVLATMTVLPYMSTAREDAFRIEASNAVSAAQDAVDLYYLNKISLKGDTRSCVKDNVFCFKVDELIDVGTYDVDKGIFEGTVKVDVTDRTKPKFTLNFKKNEEFRFIGETHQNYRDKGELSNAEWKDEYNSCSCE